MDWLNYARKHFNKSDHYDLECEVKDAKQIDAEITHLRAEKEAAEAACEAVCDSYAKENQQFSDEIERLRDILDKIFDLADQRTPWDRQTESQ
jgi:hypothetical protein